MLLYQPARYSFLHHILIPQTVIRRCFDSRGAVVKGRGFKKPLEQWSAIAARYPCHLIFFRFGAFYELLKDHAVIASQILNIRVNRLGRAGFPYVYQLKDAII